MESNEEIRAHLVGALLPFWKNLRDEALGCF